MQIKVTKISYSRDSGWFVSAVIESESGTRHVSHVLDLPKDADEALMEEMLLGVYL